IEKNITTWSDETYRIFGVNPEEFKGTYEALLNLIHPEDKKLVQALQKDISSHQKPGILEFRIVRPDGSVRFVQGQTEADFDGEGKPVKLADIIRDITAQKLAEEALRASEENFRNSIDSSPIGIMISSYLAKPFEILYVNRTLLDMYGYRDIEEMKSVPIKERYTPESYAAYLIRHKKLLRGEVDENNFELSIRRKDGMIRHLEVFRKEVLWDGKPQLQTICRDITAHKQAEEMVKISELRYRRLFEAAKDGILILAADTGLILDVNPFLIEILGLSYQEIIGKELWELGFLKDIFASRANFLELQRKGYIRYEDLPLQTADGKQMHVEFVSNVYEVAHQKIIQCNIRDITARKLAEQALHASEENFRNSMDNSPMGIVITSYLTDPVEILYVNQALLDIYGYRDIEEMKSAPVKERYTPESYAAYLLRQEKRRRGEATGDTSESSIIRKDGAIHHLQAFYKTVEWDGKTRLQTFYRDITAQKQAELALTESEKKYRELVETAQEGIMAVDDESRITFVNQRMGEILGYTIAEMVGKHPFDFLDEKGKKILRQQLERRHFGIRDEYDIEYCHKDGRHIFMRVGGNPLYDVNGKYSGSMAVMVDISALKQAEERILHLNSVLNALRAVSQLITTEKDKESLLRKSCDLLVHTRGYETAWISLTDKDGKFISGASSGIKPGVFASLVKRLKTENHPPCIDTLLKQDNTTLICREIGMSKSDCQLTKLGKNRGALAGKLVYEGRLYGFLSVQIKASLAIDKDERGLFSELTNDIAFALYRLEQETQLEEAQMQAYEAKKLREVDRLRSELLANVSHELRTPLSSIKGFTSTLLRKDVKWSAKQRQDFLQTIDSETDRLTRLISDILDMSRIEAGALKLKQQQCNISEVVDSVKGRLEVLTAHHRLKIVIPEKLPPVFVDEMRIGQVISNLVENAVKFSPVDSAITVAAHLEKKNIIVSVADQGEGMTKEVQGKIFNRFYQAEDVVTGRKGGTGLGLAICWGIVKGHGGEMRVESKVKEGSKFSFSLPVIEKETNEKNTDNRQ
ncbi:MAG: PAS domain S-box protein, partial [Dehalococcoidales bacterium]|nr:PAS domain S-box protein [Dehalococcoidales bacterium]